MDSTPSYNQISNNYIGTDATGTQSVSGGGIGISGFASPTAQADQNVINGNLISGNTGNGITLCDADGTVIMNNLIGTDRTGTSPLGNAAVGILLTCAGSPSNQIVGNIIAFNDEEGIMDEPDYRYGVSYTPDGHQSNRFSQNSIFANGGIGINLLPPPFGYYDEVTPNDTGDGDVGGNLLQNFPVVTEAQSSGATLSITGTLNSNANQSFTVELFLNNSLDSSGHGEGEVYLTSVTITTASNGNGNFAVTLPQAASAGQSITATATNANGNTSEFSTAMLVTILNQPPTAVAGGPYFTFEGTAVILDGSGSSDPDGNITSYAWDLDNDGQYDDATGITTTVTFGDNGSYVIGLLVTDSGGLTDEDTAVVTVDNVAPIVEAGGDQSSVEGSIVSLPPATFSDPGSHDTHTATVDWGDGAVEPAVVNMGTVSASHVYAENDVYLVTVCVVDDDGDSGCDSFTVTVDNVAPSLVNLAATPFITETGQVTVTGSIIDPGTLDSFTLVVDWADNITETLAYPAGSSSFLLNHTYEDDARYQQALLGDFTIHLTLTDDDGGQDTGSVIITVNNAAPQLTNLTITPVMENETATLAGVIREINPADSFTLIVDWGDGYSDSFTYPAGTIAFTETHTYLDDNYPENSFPVTLTLTDDDGGADVAVIMAEVQNAIPVVNAGADLSTGVGRPVNFNGSFTDSGTLDTHTILWDFGDGHTISGTLLPTHLYATPGTYVVTLTITDDDGGIGQGTLTVTVLHTTFIPVVRKSG
jgi:parallel beta-helix repeat protein